MFAKVYTEEVSNVISYIGKYFNLKDEKKLEAVNF